MASNKPLPEEESTELLFEAPELEESQDIELQEVRHTSKGNETENLLASFQTDSSDETDSDGFSLDNDHNKTDVRLSSTNANSSDEVAALHERINRNLMNASSSSSSADNSHVAPILNPTQPNTDTPDQQNTTEATPFKIKDFFTFNSIRNNFNFLDRVYKPLPVNRSTEVGSGSDGVFSNLSAKPDLNSAPVESDKPPTYDEVSQDQTPPYWENSVISPGFMDEVFIDGLPVGNIINFIWNLLVSSSFQFVGFLLTYLLHTSHAAKHGSRAGLGVTFIVYGYSMIPRTPRSHGDDGSLQDFEIQPDQPNDFNNVDMTADKVAGSLDHFTSSLSSGVSAPEQEEAKPAHLILVGICVIAMGVFVLVKAFVNYHRAKKMEEVILQPPAVASVEEQV